VWLLRFAFAFSVVVQVLVRTEELNISGSLFRNKEKFARFVRKVTATNPTRGPWHYRSPSKILWRVIRGMLPHKVRHKEEWPGCADDCRSGE